MTTSRLILACLIASCSAWSLAQDPMQLWLPDRGNIDSPYLQRQYENYERDAPARELNRLRDSLGVIGNDAERYTPLDPYTSRAIDEQMRRDGYELLFDERNSGYGGEYFRGNRDSE